MAQCLCVFLRRALSLGAHFPFHTVATFLVVDREKLIVSYLKSFVMVSVQDGKAVFVKQGKHSSSKPPKLIMT